MILCEQGGRPVTDQPRYFIADDEGDPTLYDRRPDPWNDHEPVAVVRRSQVNPEEWRRIEDTQEPLWDDRPAGPDTFTESRFTREGEEEFTVTRYPGGTVRETPGHVVRAAPGAPYAGPDTIVAGRARARDLLDADMRRRVRDGIQGGEL